MLKSETASPRAPVSDTGRLEASARSGMGSSGDHKAHSCEICKSLDALYEADSPQFTSRMEGKQWPTLRVKSNVTSGWH
jgi:hypothetical protein